MDDFEEERFLEIMYRRMGCFPMLMLCAALSMVGCGTIRESGILEVHDTLIVSRRDTVREYRDRTLIDTVHQWHTNTITLNADGDTMRIVENRYYKERIVERDSSDRYRSSLDSLKAVLRQLQTSEKVIEKKPPWWQAWKWNFTAVGALIALLLALFTDIRGKIIQAWKDR